MRANEILGVEDVRFIEPVFSSLTDTRINADLAATKTDEGRLLLDAVSYTHLTLPTNREV